LQREGGDREICIGLELELKATIVQDHMMKTMEKAVLISPAQLMPTASMEKIKPNSFLLMA
jgi:hypothetical protein